MENGCCRTAVLPAPSWFVIKDGNCTARATLWSIQISGVLCSREIRNLSFTGENWTYFPKSLLTFVINYKYLLLQVKTSSTVKIPPTLRCHPKRTSKEIMLVYCSTFIIFVIFYLSTRDTEGVSSSRGSEKVIWFTRPHFICRKKCISAMYFSAG